MNEICPSCYGLGTVGDACTICGKVSTHRVSKFEEQLARDLRRRAARDEAAEGRGVHWTAVAAEGRAGGGRFRCSVCGTVVRTKTPVERTAGGVTVVRTVTGIPPEECPHCYLPTATREPRTRPRVRRHLRR